MPLGCGAYVIGWGKGYMMCPYGSTTITSINRKSSPPIPLFNDVADSDELDAVYENGEAY